MAKVTGKDMGSQTLFVGRGSPVGGLDGTIWQFNRPMMPTLCATNLDDHPKFQTMRTFKNESALYPYWTPTLVHSKSLLYSQILKALVESRHGLTYETRLTRKQWAVTQHCATWTCRQKLQAQSHFSLFSFVILTCFKGCVSYICEGLSHPMHILLSSQLIKSLWQNIIHALLIPMLFSSLYIYINKSSQFLNPTKKQITKNCFAPT